MTIEQITTFILGFLLAVAINDLIVNFVFMKRYKRFKEENEKLKIELEVKKNEQPVRHVWSFGVPYVVNNHISLGQGVPQAQEGKHTSQE